ncbi:uncharacterized protein RCC_07727 [Ramularia collo-cygni]|uniref:Uncharacterized protein n=1 Tax=Ramularia collo-cygni TaxID=112498 RepID=A0A2D3V8U6_9PEZI|nr:uncharacterized protein RCC_07727 [Ramularia collo-cygni]CZT21860.1 uncharacterized protein RCC_07727 [Ramularia collo-cygni]
MVSSTDSGIHGQRLSTAFAQRGLRDDRVVRSHRHAISPAMRILSTTPFHQAPIPAVALQQEENKQQKRNGLIHGPRIHKQRRGEAEFVQTRTRDNRVARFHGNALCESSSRGDNYLEHSIPPHADTRGGAATRNRRTEEVHRENVRGTCTEDLHGGNAMVPSNGPATGSGIVGRRRRHSLSRDAIETQPSRHGLSCKEKMIIHSVLSHVNSSASAVARKERSRMIYWFRDSRKRRPYDLLQEVKDTRPKRNCLFRNEKIIVHSALSHVNANGGAVARKILNASDGAQHGRRSMPPTGLHCGGHSAPAAALLLRIHEDSSGNTTCPKTTRNIPEQAAEDFLASSPGLWIQEQRRRYSTEDLQWFQSLVCRHCSICSEMVQETRPTIQTLLKHMAFVVKRRGFMWYFIAYEGQGWRCCKKDTMSWSADSGIRGQKRDCSTKEGRSTTVPSSWPRDTACLARERSQGREGPSRFFMHGLCRRNTIIVYSISSHVKDRGGVVRKEVILQKPVQVEIYNGLIPRVEDSFKDFGRLAQRWTREVWLTLQIFRAFSSSWRGDQLILHFITCQP